MVAKKEKSCINPSLVPCEKARNYLEKKGLLCSGTEGKTSTEKSPKKKKKKGVFDWILSFLT